MNMVSEPLPAAQPGRYEKAPAVEVIFNIRTALSQPLDPASFLKPVENAFPDTFSEYKEFRTFESQVVLKGDGSSDHDTKSQMAGYRFMAPDQGFLAHYLLHGLSLNFLKPYVGYQPSLEVFQKHWALYDQLSGNAPVVGLSLRYIDRIDIPRDGEAFSLGDYFTIAPPTLGLKAHNCYVQYHLNDDAEDVRARVIWSSLEDKPGHWSFALDTEATLEPVTLSNADDIWLQFDRLHDWCTHVFEKSLTPKCKQLFQ